MERFLATHGLTKLLKYDEPYQHLVDDICCLPPTVIGYCIKPTKHGDEQHQKRTMPLPAIELRSLSCNTFASAVNSLAMIRQAEGARPRLLAFLERFQLQRAEVDNKVYFPPRDDSISSTDGIANLVCIESRKACF